MRVGFWWWSFLLLLILFPLVTVLQMHSLTASSIVQVNVEIAVKEK